MRVNDAYRRFRANAKNYGYFFFRRNLGTRIPAPAGLFVGIARLGYFVVQEMLYFRRRPADAHHDTLVLIGSHNNEKAYRLIEKYLPAHERATFHTYRSDAPRLNFLSAYLTGVPSIGFVLMSVLRNVGCAALLAKNADVFVLANGRVSRPQADYLAGFRHVIVFSEYSAYVNKILEGVRRPGLVYFPHARLPRLHPEFSSSTIFVDADNAPESVARVQAAFKIKNLDKFIRQSADGRRSGHSTLGGRGIMICTNVIDSVFTTARLAKKVRAAARRGERVVIRPHPAEKFKRVKKFIFRVYSGSDCEWGGNFLESLSGVRYLYAGMSGVLLEALDSKVKLYSYVPAAKLVAYFNCGGLLAVKGADELLEDIATIGDGETVSFDDPMPDRAEVAKCVEDELCRAFSQVFSEDAS